MEIEFHGTSGVFPQFGQMVSLSISNVQGSILVDAGSARIFHHHQGKSIPKNILISHGHHDHIAYLPHLILANLYDTKERYLKPLIVSPESIRPIMKLMDVDKELFSHSHIPPKVINGIKINSLVTNHVKKNYCYKFTSNYKSIVYTGDTAYFAALAKFCINVDLLICEASYGDDNLSKARKWGHMTPKTVAKLIGIAKPKHVILTHFVQLPGAEFVNQVQAHLNHKASIDFAHEGLTVKI